MTGFLDFRAVNFEIKKSQSILKNIHFSIQEGDFLVILGANGSGKSSLLKLMDQTYQPSRGKILLNQHLLKAYSSVEVSNAVKMLSQNLDQTIIPEMTLFENFKLWQSNKAQKPCTRQAFLAHLEHFLPVLAEKLDVALYKLSGGERQIFALSLMLLTPPSLLLLDEHTSALDPKRAKMIMKLTDEKIREYQLTSVMVTHSLEDALAYGTKLMVLKQGEIQHFFDQSEKDALTMDALRAFF